jgi:hypothetical protein
MEAHRGRRPARWLTSAVCGCPAVHSSGGRDSITRAGTACRRGYHAREIIGSGGRLLGRASWHRRQGPAETQTTKRSHGRCGKESHWQDHCVQPHRYVHHSSLLFAYRRAMSAIASMQDACSVLTRSYGGRSGGGIWYFDIDTLASYYRQYSAYMYYMATY